MTFKSIRRNTVEIRKLIEHIMIEVYAIENNFDFMSEEEQKKAKSEVGGIQNCLMDMDCVCSNYFSHHRISI